MTTLSAIAASTWASVLGFIDVDAFKGPVGGVVGLAFGAGFMSGYTFSTKTSLTAAKEYMEREKKLLEDRVLIERTHLEARMKEYKDFTDRRIADYKSDVDSLRMRVRELENANHERHA